MAKTWEQIREERMKQTSSQKKYNDWKEIARSRGVKFEEDNIPSTTSVSYNKSNTYDFTKTPQQNILSAQRNPAAIMERITPKYTIPVKTETKLPSNLPSFDEIMDRITPDYDSIKKSDVPRQSIANYNSENYESEKKPWYKSIIPAIGAGLASAAKGIAKIQDLGAKLVDMRNPAMNIISPAHSLINLIDPKGKLPLSEKTSDLVEHFEKQETEAREQYMENASPAGKFIGQGVEAVSAMLPQYILSLMTGGLSTAASEASSIANVTKSAIPGLSKGSVSTFSEKLLEMTPFITQAAGQYAREAELKGVPIQNQILYGAAGGLAEGVTELLPLESLKIAVGLNDDAAKAQVKKGVRAAISMFGQKAMDWINNAGSNIIEEVTVNPITGLAEKAFIDPNKPYVGQGGVLDPQEAIESTGGALSMSLVLTAIGLPMNTVAYAIARRAIETGTPLTEEETQVLQQEVKKELLNINPVEDEEILLQQQRDHFQQSMKNMPYEEMPPTVIQPSPRQTSSAQPQQQQMQTEVLQQTSQQQTSTAVSEPVRIPGLTYGKNGKKAYKKWAANEWVNVDLNNPNNPRTQSYTAFFDKWYNAGKEGIPINKVQESDIDTDFPLFLRETIYTVGQNDAKPKPSQAPAPTPAVNTQTETTPPAVPAEPVAQEQKPTAEPTVQTLDEKKADEKPHEHIAKEVEKYLDKGIAFNSARLFEIADKAYGGTQAEGKYTVKDAYDAMELAVNKYLMNKEIPLNDSEKYNSSNISTVQKGISRFNDILGNIPTQTKRTVEMEQFQQFSTPPNIAYLAAWVANVNSSDTVLEPSAGIGGLALFPKAWGAKEVIVNELSGRRLEILKSMGFDQYFNADAEQIDNILPEDIKPTVVLMNPPFSSAALRTGDKKATANAKRHIEQALARLEPNGRLVAIVGNGMADNAPSFRDWWEMIKSKYNVRANIRIDGSNYKKYGTSFDIQLVVIDKTGPTTSETITGEYKDLMEVPKVLEGIRNDRYSGRIQAVGEVQQNEAVTENTGNSKQSGPVKTVHSTGDGGSTTDISRQQGKQRTSANAEGRNGQDRVAEPGETVQVSDGTERGEASSDMDGRKRSEGRETVQHSSADRVQPGAVANVRPEPEQSGVELEVPSEVKTIIENEDDVYSNYVPKKLKIKGAKEHVTALVESAAMAAVDPPAVSYQPNLPQNLITEGKLSIAQLENIVYAGQAHEQILPDGKRRGYFIGDGTGVGKGRQIAGIILDNFRRGRKKAVWISNDPKLLVDAIRDWTNLGQNKDDIKDLSKFKATDKIKDASGILFTSYATLKSGAKNDPSATRINQIVNWFGKDYDGVIIFDEAHNMGNAIEFGEGLKRTKASKQALAGIDLQNALPNARIVYASATGATNVHNLAYLTRLGLWGEGTSFRDVHDFIAKISSGGLAAMELVARDMKAMGLYMARNLSFKGVEYDTLTHELTPVQEEIYNTMSRAWQKVLDNIDDALEITGAKKDGRAKGRAKSQFYSAMQRFYNQIITSMSMPSVIEDIKAELAKGNSAVIQLVNTNQAATDRQIASAEEEGLELDDIDLTPADTLIEYLKRSFPIHEYEEYIDEKGNTRSRLVMDNGKPVVSREAVRKRDALIAEIKEMKVPDGPLEMLFDAFGTENVAEVTGRNRRVVPKKDSTGQIKKVLENRTPAMAIADTQAFQDGKKKILVFSDAGGTGKSYHADRTAKNQSKRIHYLLQPGWNAFKATQGFGRTHRSGQVVPPIFRLVTTNIMGQKRFTSTIAKRLDQMGALTKGQRQAGSGMFGQKDNLESDIARDALHIFYTKNLSMDIIKKMGLKDKLTDEYGNFKDDPTVTMDMNLFLNRILALEVQEQNKVFESYYSIFEEIFERALESGNIDMGLENYIAEKIEKIDTKTIYEDKTSGAKTEYVQMKAYKKPIILQYEALEEYKGNFQGLVRLNSTGEVRAVYKSKNKTLQSGEVVATYILQSPVLVQRSTYIQSTLDEKTTPIPKKEWKKSWNEEINKAPEYTEETLHMLTGTLLPVWDKLPNTNTRVIRIITDDGKQYLGRIINSNEIDAVLRKFNVGRKKEVYTSKELYKRIMENGEIVQLEKDKIKLLRRRVSGEYRIEITGNNVWWYARTFSGIITETISYNRRYFIPTGEKAYSIIEQIISNNPVVTVDKNLSSADTEEDTLVSTATGPRLGAASGENITGKAKRASEIAKDFANKLNLAIKKGGLRHDQLGNFNNQTYILRIRKANDIPVLSHETGHFLDRLYQLSTSNNAVYKELERLGTATSRPSYNQARVRREGVAEFVRLYLTDNETALSEAPTFYQYFEQQVPTDVLSVLRGIRKDIWDLVNLDPVSRVKKSISFKGDKEAKGLFDVKRFFRSIHTGLVDYTFPVEWAAGELDGEESREHIKNMLAQLRGYEGIALFDLNPKGYEGFYQTDLNGERVGKSYSEIVAPVHKTEEMRRDFWAYSVARRSRDYFRRGLELPDTQETYNETIRILEEKYPIFEQVFDELVEYRNNLANLLVESGVYSEEMLERIREANPNYVPLKRIKEAFSYVSGSSTKLSGAKKLIKRLRGGGETIQDPGENDINNTFLYRSVSLRNKLLVELANLADQAEGKGYIMARSARKLTPVTFNLEKVRSALEEMGIEAEGIDLDVMVRIFQPNYLAGPNQIVVYRNGEPQLYDIHPDIYEAVSGLSPQEMTKLIEILMTIGQVQKTGIIFTPKYISYNFSRDTFHNLVASQSGINMIDIIQGCISVIRKDDWYKLAMRKGGTTNYFTANDRKFAQEAIDDILAGQNKARDFRNKILHPLRTIQDAIEVTELAGRIAEMRKTLKKLGNSDAAVEKAIANMRDLSIDFRKSGLWIKKLQANRLVNFLNSQIQGSSKFLRLLTNKKTAPGAIAKGILYITVPTLLLLWINKDNEYYDELPWYRKDFFWNIPIGDPKTTNLFIPIPKPWELGILFGAIPERLVTQAMKDDPTAWDDFGDSLKQTFLPEYIPSALQPWLEDKMGVDWRGIPILSQSDKNLSATAPELQYNKYTSGFSKTVSNLVKDMPVPEFMKSPKRLDHMIKGYTGTLGSIALESIDQWTGQKEGVPVIGGLVRNFVVDAKKTPQSEEEYYRYKKILDSQYYEYKKTGEIPENYHPEIRQLFNKVSEEIEKINKKEDVINIAEINKAIKDSLIDELEKQKLELIRLANKYYLESIK